MATFLLQASEALPSGSVVDVVPERGVAGPPIFTGVMVATGLLALGLSTETLYIARSSSGAVRFRTDPERPGGAGGRYLGQFESVTGSSVATSSLVSYQGALYSRVDEGVVSNPFVAEEWEIAAGLVGVPSIAKGVANGVASLGADGIVPSAQLPPGVATRPVLLPFASPGDLVVGGGTSRIYLPTAGTIQSVEASVGTAPDGQPAIIDVDKNGTTIFTTQANRPSIAALAHTSGKMTPDVATFSIGDYLTVDIDQVGILPVSTVAFVSLEPLTTTAATFDVTRPPAAQAGDIVLLQLRISSATETVPAITGWTQIGAVTTGGTSRMYYFWRIDDGAAGPWTFATGGATSTTWSVNVCCYRGVHQTLPIDSSVVSVQSSGSSTWVFSDLTTVNANVTEVLFGYFNTAVIAPTPASYTSRYGFGTGSTASRGVADIVRATAGLSTGPTVVLGASTTGHRGRIGLRPAASPPTFTPGKDLTGVVRYLEG